MDQGSNKNHSPVYNFAPTVTKFCVMWEGQALPHDTKFGNCRYKIVDSRAFPSWSLIHGLRWSGLIKAEPDWDYRFNAPIKCTALMSYFTSLWDFFADVNTVRMDTLLLPLHNPQRILHTQATLGNDIWRAKHENEMLEWLLSTPMCGEIKISKTSRVDSDRVWGRFGMWQGIYFMFYTKGVATYRFNTSEVTSQLTTKWVPETKRFVGHNLSRLCS